MNNKKAEFPSMKTLKWFFLLIDLSFILYFGSTALRLIPPEYAFSDYQNPIVVAWNWSFFPLDMVISATGLAAVYLYKKRHPYWMPSAFISLALTCCSGLMALSFWAIRLEFDLMWWLPNLFLMIYPLFFIPAFIKRSSQHRF